MSRPRLSYYLATAVAAVTIAAVSLTACSKGNSEETISVGTTDASKKAWKAFQEVAKEKGFNIKLVPFQDYSTPNRALSQGKIDTNNFQHLQFLAEYNVGNDADLVPIVATEIVPLALFWKGHDSLEGIEGETVVVPNDTTNLARALNVLKEAKLIEFKNDDVILPTLADIDTEASKVKVTAVDAAQTTSAWGEGKPAIINNSFLDRAGIDPSTAIFADDPSAPSAEPFINAFVVKKEDADNKRIKDLAQLWHTDQVQKAVQDDSDGTSVPVKRSEKELKQILDRLEENLRKQK